MTPNGTLYLAAQANGTPNTSLWVSRFVNNTWVWTDLGQRLGGLAKDVALTAYADPSKISGIALTLWAVGPNNCGIYYWNSDGTNWGGPATWTTACYKTVSSFPTGDGGVFMLFLGTSNSALYTQRFTGTAWGGIVQQPVQPWLAATGAHFDDTVQSPNIHYIVWDDCREQISTQVCYPFPGLPGVCATPDLINLAEVLFNEARSETIGAQAVVGWTVRNRAYKGLKTPAQCGTYPGAESGGERTKTCRNTLPCTDPNFCDGSKRICCAIHGGTLHAGEPGNQVNDEHVDYNTLATRGFITRAHEILNGRLLDMSNPSWKPAGISGCPQTLTCGTLTAGGPQCTSGMNVAEVPDSGPMEFLAYDYCAKTNGAPLTSCKWYAGDVCGNTDSSIPPDGNPVEVPLHSSTCAQTNPRASGDNFFWNRQP